MRILAAVCLLYASGPSPCAAPSPAQDPPLPEILSRSARYCERLKGLALHFVCHERIRIETCSYRHAVVWRRGPGGYSIDRK